MTNRLVDDRDAVAVLAQQVADLIDIPASHMEKDFWVTEVLRGAVAAAADGGLEIVFKGGTSLSKAFRLIQRFSEDVDLLVVIPGSLGTGAADTKLKALVGGAATTTGLMPEVVPGATSKGVKRGARFHYRNHEDASGLSAGVFLEIGSRGGAMPATLIAVKSILAEPARQELADFAESEPVHVRVLDPCRTLVEKLVLLHTAHMTPDPHDAIRGARHYYDVHQLLGNPGVSPAFTDSPHLAVARERYEQSVVRQLLWPQADQPSFDACLSAASNLRVMKVPAMATQREHSEPRSSARLRDAKSDAATRT